MTTELEQKFFRVFGIAKQHLLNVNTNQFVDVYPEITAEKLLEMICILSGCCNCTLEFKTKNIEDLKNGILQQAINRSTYALNKQKYKQQIQQLFKEEQ